jgi:drug/metabolite transporter (DMT)-like permease
MREGQGPTQVRPATSKILVAILTVYFAWGAWFTLSSLAVRDIPPIIGVGFRDIASAALVVFVLWCMRQAKAIMRVTRRELFGCFLVGGLIETTALLLTAAEKTVPSALAAVIFATVPIVVLIMRRMLREYVPLMQFISCGVGLAGIALLVIPGHVEGNATPFAFILLLFAVLSWSISILLGAKVSMPENPMVSTMYSLLIAGIWMFVLGWIVEGGTFSLSNVSFVSWLGNSLIIPLGTAGLVAYLWTLRNVGVTVASTEVYITPVVAVLLGVILLKDPMTVVGAIGALIVVGSVAFIVRSETRVPQVGTPGKEGVATSSVGGVELVGEQESPP